MSIRYLPRIEHYTWWQKFTNSRLEPIKGRSPFKCQTRKRCIYYLIPLSLKIKILLSFKNEIKTKDKLCNFLLLYNSPTQSQDDFESCINNLESVLDSFISNCRTIEITVRFLLHYPKFSNEGLKLFSYVYLSTVKNLL